MAAALLVDQIDNGSLGSSILPLPVGPVTKKQPFPVTAKSLNHVGKAERLQGGDLGVDHPHGDGGAAALAVDIHPEAGQPRAGVSQVELAFFSKAARCFSFMICLARATVSGGPRAGASQGDQLAVQPYDRGQTDREMQIRSISFNCRS